jgi:hypothetical protein
MLMQFIRTSKWDALPESVQNILIVLVSASILGFIYQHFNNRRRDKADEAARRRRRALKAREKQRRGPDGRN